MHHYQSATLQACDCLPTKMSFTRLHMSCYASKNRGSQGEKASDVLMKPDKAAPPTHWWGSLIFLLPLPNLTASYVLLLSPFFFPQLLKEDIKSFCLFRQKMKYVQEIQQNQWNAEELLLINSQCKHTCQNTRMDINVQADRQVRLVRQVYQLD